MSIDTQLEQEAKVLKDLNLHSASSPMPPVHRIARILAILCILAILLQTKEPLRSFRTFFSLLPRAIDIKVFQTFSASSCCVSVF